MIFLLKLVKTVIFIENFINFHNFYLLNQKVPGIHTWWKTSSMCPKLKIKSRNFCCEQNPKNFYKTFEYAKLWLFWPLSLTKIFWASKHTLKIKPKITKYLDTYKYLYKNCKGPVNSYWTQNGSQHFVKMGRKNRKYCNKLWFWITG